MTSNFTSEQWKAVNFGQELNYDYRLEVSNNGRLRTFNKLSDGNIVKGSMVNGYRIIRVKLFRAREEKVQQQFAYLQQQVSSLARQLKVRRAAGESDATLKETVELLQSLKKNLEKATRKELNERTINFQALVHRLVAELFLPAPTAEQTVVAHLDHDKLNNRPSNLKWMTPTENYEHQQKSPHMIKEKKERKEKQGSSTKSAKLTVTRVMFLKKLLNQGKSVRQLAKTFKVTDTQIIRIKRGENWTDVKAAE